MTDKCYPQHQRVLSDSLCQLVASFAHYLLYTPVCLAGITSGVCLGAVLVYGLVVPVHFIILPLIGPVENYNFKSLGHRATAELVRRIVGGSWL